MKIGCFCQHSNCYSCARYSDVEPTPSTEGTTYQANGHDHFNTLGNPIAYRVKGQTLSIVPKMTLPSASMVKNLLYSSYTL